MSTRLLLLLTLAIACGSRDRDSGAPDAGSAADAAVKEDAARSADATSEDAETPADAGSDPTDGGDRWAAVRALLDERAQIARDFGLIVFDAEDRLVFAANEGSFTADQRVAVASASKLIAGMVLLELVARGDLTLDSTTGEVLGWTGPKATIALSHLLSFTSGMENEHMCTANRLITLEECVDLIALTALKAEPGTTFEYGATHLHVAARMAEVVTGSTWNELFSTILRVPLGLPEEVAYFTNRLQPNLANNRQNPLVAGGMRASMNEYAKLLQLAFHRGQSEALTVGSPELFALGLEQELQPLIRAALSE